MDDRKIPTIRIRATIKDPQQSTTLMPSSKAERNVVIKAFLESQDVKKSSLKTYKESITQYFNWLDATKRSLQSLTTADIIEYKQFLLRSGHQTLTVRSYMIAVRKFYKWAEGMKFYANIAGEVKAPSNNKGGAGEHFTKMHLTEEQGTALLQHFKNNKRNYAIINLMLRTGLRTIEVSRAKIEDIKLRGGKRILQVWGKGMDAPDPSVYVVLTDAAYGPIREYLNTRPEALNGEYLFVTEGRGSHTHETGTGTLYIKDHHGEQMSTRLIQMIIKKGLRAIGLDDHAYSAHSLRHTTATQIIKNGGTILDVKRTLRHSSINTSMIYTASIEEEERLKNPAEDLLDKSFRDK